MEGAGGTAAPTRRALLAAAAAIPAARRARGATGATPRDTLRIGVIAPRGLGTLDPHMATAHVDRMAASWIFGGLARFRPGSVSPSDLEPDLAEDWSASPDRRAWTFRLRRGVAFHGGFGEVTAEDAAFSLRKAMDPRASAASADYAAVEAVEASDPSTLRVTLRQPLPFFPGLVANYAGGFVLSRRAWEAARGTGMAAAVGTGPFRPVSEEPGQSLHFAAHDDHVRGRPALRAIQVRFLGSAGTGDLAFRAGELDVVEGQADAAWIARMRDDGAVVDVIEPSEISWLHLDVTKPPLDDPRVRRAVALAVGRSDLAAWRGAEVARPARGVVPASYRGFASRLTLPETDVAAARRLLAEAGHPAGLTLRTIHTGNPGMLNAILVVQAQLRRAGIALDVRVVDHQTYHRMIRDDLSPVVHYAAARFPLAEIMLTQFFHSGSTVGRQNGASGGVTNFSHCAVADAALDAAREEPDPERQAALLAEAQARILDADCAVPLIETRGVWGRRADFDYGFAFAGAMSTGPLVTERSAFTT